MKKSLLFLLSFWIVFSAAAVNSNPFTISLANEDRSELQFALPAWSFADVNVNGQPSKSIFATGAYPLLAKGSPELPSFAISVPVAATGNVRIEVSFGTFTDYNGIEMAPSKGSLKRDIDPATVAYEFGPAYSQNAFYPAEAALIGSPYIIRDARFISLRAFPFQYNPVTKVLRVYSDLQIAVITDRSQTGINELASSTARGGNDQVAYVPVGETGGRMLIIGPAAYQTTMQSFIDWKKQKGIETDYVTIESIGNTQSSIYTYVDNYYSMYPALNFLLIAGDHQQVASYNAGMAGSEIKWSDSEYGQLVGNDKYPDIFVGRFPAQTTTELQNMLTRTMEYETYPDLGTWYGSYIGIGSDQGAGYGDDGEADWEHMRNIGQVFQTYGYTTFYEFFDGSHGGFDASGNPNATMVTNAVNTGAGQFFYCGHGAQNVCVTSNFSSTDVWAASNNHKYPFVVSVACNNGTFTAGTCLAEDFLLSNNSNGPTGAIGACGSSILMAWAEPMEVQDEMANLLTGIIDPNAVKHTLGGMFYNGGMSMLDAYGNSGTAQEVMETWVMFGDPSVMIRTEMPTNLSVTHPTWMTIGATSMQVLCPTEGALVCITDNNVILGTGYISGGSTTITLPPLTAGSVLVTVTAFNKIPYQSIVTVSPTGMTEQNSISNLSVYPNPADEFVNVNYISATNSDAVVEIVNTLGQLVYTTTKQQEQTGLQQIAIPVSTLESGVYFLRITTAEGSLTQRLSIR